MAAFVVPGGEQCGGKPWPDVVKAGGIKEIRERRPLDKMESDSEYWDKWGCAMGTGVRGILVS